MHDFSEDPQTLYQAWNGHWPFRRWLYVGITNSPSRRFGEHRRRSEWMLEAGTIRLVRFPDRESVMEAERRMICAKRPQYNVQHNRHEVEVELSAENLAAAGAAVCLSILALRWLADVSSQSWVKRQARRQGVTVELPPRRNPFTEPSLTLTMLGGFCTMMAGDPGLARPAVPVAVPVPVAPAAESSAVDPWPVWAGVDPVDVAMPPASAQSVVVAALLVMLAAGVICAAGVAADGGLESG
jgi:predicted GIY-YIG superfamily endonuclease